MPVFQSIQGQLLVLLSVTFTWILYTLEFINYIPALKKWGLYWTFPVCPSVTLLICISVILSFCHNSFFFNILRMNGQNLTTFCVHIIIDKIYIGIVNRHFFCKFATELRPLIDVRIQFLFNILRMNGQNLTKYCIHIH